MVSFVFGFISVCDGGMTYYAWVSMGASMSGDVCFFSLRVCVHMSVWVG